MQELFINSTFSRKERELLAQGKTQITRQMITRYLGRKVGQREKQQQLENNVYL